MTERLYYSDAYCQSFEATVTRTFEHDGRPAVTLDRTAFYPTSGGQPHDTGRLGAIAVLDCVDDDDDVVHVLSGPLDAGARVVGAVDWDRRFDHMQQHTGQHVLSASFDRLFGNRTVGFHMGAETSTIDLARPMAPAEVEAAVAETNRVVWDDRDVRVRFVSDAEAARLPLRKESGRVGTLRLVEVPDVDLSACGGTHVARTGQIGLVVVTATERLRGGARMTFACGARVERLYRELRDAVAGSVRLLSVLPHELPGAIERSQADNRELRKTLARLQARLARFEADTLLSSSPTVGGLRVVVRALDGWDAAGLKSIAAALTSAGGTAAALFSSETPAHLVVARSDGVPVQAHEVLRTLLQRFGGRGGGRSDLAQAAGLTGSTPQMLLAAAELLGDAGREPG